MNVTHITAPTQYIEVDGDQLCLSPLGRRESARRSC